MTNIKKFIAITTAIILGSVVLDAHAQESDHEICQSVSELAKVIMENRQGGVSMSRSMGAADNDITETIIINAYERPAYSTADYQNKAVSEFADTWYLGCIKARR